MLLQRISNFLLFSLVSCFPTSIKRQDAANSTIYGRLIVFGDSFSDSGNGSWLVSNKTWPSDPAYYGHHFSNGPVWAEVVATNYSLELIDMAVGGATSDNDFVQGYTGYNSTIPVNSTNLQIETFLSNDSFSESDIAVIWVGANDILFNTTIDAQATLFYIGRQVLQLYNANASTVVLLNYMDLAILPAEQSFLSATGIVNVTTYVRDLGSGLDALATAYNPFLNISVVDIYSLYQTLSLAPEIYGFNASYVYPQPVACLIGAYPEEGPRQLCNDPNQHLFFDTYHPSAPFHNLIAASFLTTLASITD